MLNKVMISKWINKWIAPSVQIWDGLPCEESTSHPCAFKPSGMTAIRDALEVTPAPDRWLESVPSHPSQKAHVSLYLSVPRARRTCYAASSRTMRVPKTYGPSVCLRPEESFLQNKMKGMSICLCPWWLFTLVTCKVGWQCDGTEGIPVRKIS